MKKGSLLCIVYLLVFGHSLAQTGLPPVYEIRSDTAFKQVLNDSLWQKLEDQQGKWTFAEVSRLPLSQKFHAPGVNGAVDTSAIHTYW